MKLVAAGLNTTTYVYLFEPTRLNPISFSCITQQFESGPVAYLFGRHSDGTALISGCALLLLLLADLAAMAALQQLKTSEMPRRVEKLLHALQGM